MGAVRQNLEAMMAGTQQRVDQLHAEFAAGLAQFQAGQRIDGDRYVPVGRAMLSNGSSRLVGWSVRAEGGDVVATLHNGTDASGDVVAVISLAAGAVSTPRLGKAGVSCPAGVFINVTGAGALVGSVFLGAVD